MVIEVALPTAFGEQRTWFPCDVSEILTELDDGVYRLKKNGACIEVATPEGYFSMAMGTPAILNGIYDRSFCVFKGNIEGALRRCHDELFAISLPHGLRIDLVSKNPSIREICLQNPENNITKAILEYNSNVDPELLDKSYVKINRDYFRTNQPRVLLIRSDWIEGDIIRREPPRFLLYLKKLYEH